MVGPLKRFFKPACRLQGQTIFTQFLVENLDGHGVRFEWDVQRDNTNAPDQGVITMHNVAPVVRELLYQQWSITNFPGGFEMTFSLGWDGVAQVLMKGTVAAMNPSLRDPTDVMTVVTLGDGAQVLRDRTLGKSMFNVNLNVVLTQFIQLAPSPTDIAGGGLGLRYSAQSKAIVSAAVSRLPVQVWSTIVAGDSMRSVITAIMETLKLDWRVHNGEFVVMQAGTIIGDAILLEPRTGLLDWSDRDDGGILLSALADPDLQPGRQILVRDSVGKPVSALAYRVEKVQFIGASDGESIMDIEARKSTVI